MLFNRGNAISGAPLVKGQTSSQNHQLKQHYKEKYHDEA